MTDALLADTDREEALSRAYVMAVAGMAGYVVAQMDFDRDGVDLQLRAGGSFRPCLDVQLKATIKLGEAKEGVFRYSLKRRNYDLLRIETQTPRILIVLDLPQERESWLDVTLEHLILRRCAYWATLGGLSDTRSQESVAISIRQQNRFDIDNLKSLMAQSRKGSIA